MRRTVVVATLVIIALAACNTEKRRLMARIAEIERQESGLRQRMEERRRAVLDAERRLDAANSELTEHNSEVHRYIVQHGTAAACIRAANITLGDENEYSSQIASAARWGSILCAVAVLNSRFALEVTQVANRIDEADRRAREMKRRMAEIQRTVDAEQSHLRNDESMLDGVASELADLRYQLSLQ